MADDVYGTVGTNAADKMKPGAAGTPGQQVGPGMDDGKQADTPPKPIQIAAKDDTEYAIKVSDITKKCADEFVKWESWRRPYDNLWNEIYRIYMNVIMSFKTPSRSKIFIPVVFQAIEAALPKLLNVLIAQREFFEVMPDDPAKDTDRAENIKRLVLYQLDRAKLFVKFVSFLKQLLLYGTSYMYLYWLVKRDWVWTRTPVRKQVSFLGITLGSRIVDWKETKSFEVLERRPEMEVLDVLDVYPDPVAETVEDGHAVYVRSWIDKEDLKEFGGGPFPIYANTDNPEVTGGNVASYSQMRQVRYGARGVTNPVVEEKNMVEILTRWGKWDLDGDGKREQALIVIANRRVLLKAGPNPFYHQKIPIIKAGLFPVPREWFAIGLVEPVVPLQHELNTVRRQRLDNINMILNRMWKVNVLADVDMDTLISIPDGVVLTDDMEAVQPLETPDVTQSSYTDAALIQQDIENVTAPRSVQGTPENGRLGRTARGAQLIISQALEKFGTAARLIDESALTDMLGMWHQLNEQFIDDDETLRNPRLYGGVFDPNITVEEIRAAVRFRLTGPSELVDKEARISQLTAFLGIFKGFLSPPMLSLIMTKIWTLMNFDKAELQGVQPAVIPAATPAAQTLAPETQNQNQEASITGQIQRNGAAAPVSIPGVKPPMRGGI